MKTPKAQKGLSLKRFAYAKTTSYNKTKAKEKEFALNAKKVNKYRKLKQRYAKAGKLVPMAEPTAQKDDDDEEGPLWKAPRSNKGSSPRALSQGIATSLEMDRRSRAGALPDEESDLSDESDMVGEEGAEDMVPAAAQGKNLANPLKGIKDLHHAAQTRSHSSIRGRQAHFGTAAGAMNAQQRDAHQQRPSTQDHDRLRMPAVASTAVPPGTERTTGASRQAAEGTAGKKATDGNPHRSKPLSRVQRIAAEVQARKDAEAKAREERRAGMEAHRAKVAETEKQRKQQTKLLRKRTRHGQPVMRYRMDKLLGQLQAEAHHC